MSAFFADRNIRGRFFQDGKISIVRFVWIEIIDIYTVPAGKNDRVAEFIRSHRPIVANFDNEMNATHLSRGSSPKVRFDKFRIVVHDTPFVRIISMDLRKKQGKICQFPTYLHIPLVSSYIFSEGQIHETPEMLPPLFTQRPKTIPLQKE